MQTEKPSNKTRGQQKIFDRKNRVIDCTSKTEVGEYEYEENRERKKEEGKKGGGVKTEGEEIEGRREKN